MAEVNIPAMSAFSLDAENTAERWEKYKKEFDYYAATMKATLPAQKKELFLHVGGTQLQEVFKTFKFEDEVPSFEKIIEAFDTRFTPLRNTAYWRHVFSQVTQKDDETVDSFVSRLRQTVKHCGYGEIDEKRFILDQFGNGCLSSCTRRFKNLGRLQLEHLIAIARADEADLRYVRAHGRPNATYDTNNWYKGYRAFPM